MRTIMGSVQHRSPAIRAWRRHSPITTGPPSPGGRASQPLPPLLDRACIQIPPKRRHAARRPQPDGHAVQELGRHRVLCGGALPSQRCSALSAKSALMQVASRRIRAAGDVEIPDGPAGKLGCFRESTRGSGGTSGAAERPVSRGCGQAMSPRSGAGAGHHGARGPHEAGTR